jgi:hypothetical protein
MPLLSPSLERDRFRSDGPEGQSIECQPLTVPDTLPKDARNPSRYDRYWGYAPTWVVRLADAAALPLVVASAGITLAGRTVRVEEVRPQPCNVALGDSIFS